MDRFETWATEHRDGIRGELSVVQGNPAVGFYTRMDWEILQNLRDEYGWLVTRMGKLLIAEGATV